MKKNYRLLTAILFAAIFILAPVKVAYEGSTIPLPKLSLSPDFGIGVQTGNTVTGVTTRGGNNGHGITETIDQIMQRERDNPFQYNGEPEETREDNDVPHAMKRPNPNSPDISQWPLSNTEDNINPKNIEHNSPQTVGVTFAGPKLSESGFIPPDCNGDCGPTQILVTGNGRIKVFDKTGVLGALNTTTDNFFTSVRSAGTSDAHVRYDRLTQRWFISMIDVATPNRVMLAVSSGSNITGAASFTFYFFQHDLVGTTPNADTGGFADYDTLGLDKFALYIGVNVFNAAGTAFLGTTGFVINKTSLISGTLFVTPFRQLCTGSGAGPYTPQGVYNDDPNSTEGYFIGTDNAVFSQLDIRRITNPGGVPSISGNITITVPTTYIPVSQVSSGGLHPLDALDDRLFAAQLKINTITGAATLWTAHNVRVNSSGVAGSGGDRNAARWYEIKNMTSTPALNQSGTLFDNAASTPRGFWIPSVAMSGQGHMALGSSTAGTNLFAAITLAGRFSSDAAGTIQSFTIGQTSATSYNVQSTATQRWGDYSQVTIDPTDNMTMWTFQEYCDATNSWDVRALQLKAPLPATPTSATSVPPNVPSVTTVITGVSSSGSGFYDPGTDPNGPGYTNRITASVTGGVIVNSVTFNSTTQVTLDISTVSAPTGFKSVTITNPDGQSLTGTNILNVDGSLPVVLLSFNGNTFDGNNVQLNWVTANEINNSGFRVERKIKNSSEWNEAGFVTGNGTTTEQKNYIFADKKLAKNIYDYRLKQIDYNGNFEYFALSSEMTIGTPAKFEVSQNYPNPSNPKTKIDYQIPFDGRVTVKIYDLTGREVVTIVNEVKEAGYYTAEFDGTNIASGIYFYRILAEGNSQQFVKTMKMVLLK